jgi:hypothetical protein
MVRFGAVFLALGRGKLYLSHGGYYRFTSFFAVKLRYLPCG